MFLDSMTIRNAAVTSDPESLTFQIGQLSRQKKLHLSCKTAKLKSKTIDTIKKTILKDTFDDWVATQKSQGKSVDLTFFEWQNLYGKYFLAEN